MDAVNRVVNAASTALWGEDNLKTDNIPHGEEPISGVQGKGIANDPYDAGNREEQPEAPASEGNTAPQEPRLDGNPLNRTEATQAGTDTAAAGGSGSSDAPKPSDTQSEQRTTVTAPETKETSENTQDENQKSEEPHHSKADDPHPHASPEALKGPQGPAPKSAEEFENEMKAKKPAEKKNLEPASSENNAPSGSANSEGNNHAGSDKGSNKSGSDKSGNGKHSTMAKMKERLSKVAHPRHGNKA